MNLSSRPSMSRLATLWLLIVLMLLGLLAVQLRSGARIETNILELLPHDQHDALANYAMDRFSKEVGQKVLFLVSSTDRVAAQTGARAFATQLKGSSVFQSLQYEFSGDELNQLSEAYRSSTSQVLGKEDREMLSTSHAKEALLQRIQRILYSPMSGAASAFIKEDPFLLVFSFLQGLPRPAPALELNDGMLSAKYQDRFYVLVAGTLLESAFSRELQEEIYRLREDAVTRLQQQIPDIQIVKSGLLWFAKAGADEIESQINVVSWGSMIGMLLLLTYIFQSLTLTLLSVVPLVVGLLVAVTISFAVFPWIHMVTLGFGSSLLGVAMDFSTYYLCERTSIQGSSSEKALTSVLPALRAAFFTSVLGYAALIFAPFPGLQQMAVFSCAGLLGAFLTVLCWLPLLTKNSQVVRDNKKANRIVRALQRWINLRDLSSRAITIIGVLFLIFSLFGLSRLRANDDIRRLQNAPDELISQEKLVQEITKKTTSSVLLIVRGASVEEVLQREEMVRSKLAAHKEEGIFSGIQATSMYVPSYALQQANAAAVCKLISSERDFFLSQMSLLGFEPDTILNKIQKCTEPLIPLLPSSLFETAIGKQLQYLWIGDFQGQQVSLITFDAVHNLTALQKIIEEVPGVKALDKVSETSELLHRYRVNASWLCVAGSLLIFMYLSFQYGFGHALRALVPPGIAIFATLGLMGLLDISINLFTVFGLFLILGVSVDYSVFFSDEEASLENTVLAVMLSAISTFLSYGLLAFGKTPVLSTFGFTLSSGVLFALLCAPIAMRWGEGDRRKR